MRAIRPTVALATILLTLPSCSRSEVEQTESNPRADTTAMEILHRAEVNALETYRLALGTSRAASLALIRDGHEEAAERLRARLAALETVPVASGASPWTGLLESLESSSPVEMRRALEILKRGEVDGLRRYTEALRDTGLDPVSKDLIRSTLLPQQREHVRMLSTRLDANE